MIPLATHPPSHDAGSSTGTDGQLTIELRRDLNLPPADAQVVRSLIAARPHVGVFLSNAWLSPFFAEAREGLEPCLAIVREGRELRGIVPLGIHREFRHVRITLLGGDAGSDRVDLLAVRGFEAPCVDALLQWLNRMFEPNALILELHGVPHDSAIWGSLHRQPESGMLVPREIHAAPFLDLRELRTENGARPEAWMTVTRSLERHRRWLERRGRVRIDLLKDPNEVQAAFDMLVRFLHERWQGRGVASALDDPEKQQFHRRILPRLMEEGLLRMLRVSVDLRTVGVFYGLATRDWWGHYLAGYDRPWSKRIHLGRLTLAFAIEQAIQAGALEFDFLKGAEPVKYLWPVRERVIVDADIYSGRAAAQLARAGHAARDLGAALANSLGRLSSWR